MEETQSREWDWVSAALLFLLLQIAAARLVATDWAPNLYWTGTLAGLGTALGLALGLSRFSRGTIFILASAYTMVILPWQLADSASGVHLLDRLSSVGATLALSFNEFLRRQPVTGTELFLVFVCTAFWVLGVVAGYSLGRHRRVLGSIAVAGAIILITQAYGSYQPRASWWLAVFVLVAVLLVGRVHFLGEKKAWARDRVFVSEESGTNVLASLFMTAAIAILAAWWIPGFPARMEGAADMWDSYFRPLRERLSNAVTSLKGPDADSEDNFYGRSLVLGENAVTGETVVFTVEVLQSPGSNLRYYWRGRAYDDYEAGGWSASDTSRLLFRPEQGAMGIPEASGRSAADLRVTSEFPIQGLIYGPSPVVWLDQSATVVGIRTAPDVFDAFLWEASAPVSAGSIYEIRSMLSNPSVQQLQAAGDDYPSWVTQQYLGVPESLRRELLDLAEEITAGSESAYDAAAAITNWLRQNIEYAQSVPAAPEGWDPVMWMLLETRRGFCNYDASAEVLMLRSMGIPARLAVGFSQGVLVNGAYIVRQLNAHAWPEVYFPGLGWVEFEPTPNQNVLTRPSEPLPADSMAANLPALTPPEAHESEAPEEVELAPPASPLPLYLTPVGRAVLAILSAMTVIIAIVLAYRFRMLARLPTTLSRGLEAAGVYTPAWIKNWERWNLLEPVERAFASVRWSLRLLGHPPRFDATPAAQATALSALMPGAARQIEVLKAELESGLFTPRGADLGKARRASAGVLWRGLRTRVHRMIAALDRRVVYSDRQNRTLP